MYTYLFLYVFFFLLYNLLFVSPLTGAIALDDEILNVLDGVVDAFYPGPHGAQAIADVLFGEYSPSGRSPITFYKSTSDLPALDEMNWYPSNVSNGISYRYFTQDVLFPFGSGMSYTTFKYDNMVVDKKTISSCDTVTVSIDVTNTGTMDSDEVVQCYVKQPHASVPVPQVRLVGFSRINLKIGEKKTVVVDIEPKSHTAVLKGDVVGEEIYTAGDSVVVEKGVFELYCGCGQPDFNEENVMMELIEVMDSKVVSDC